MPMGVFFRRRLGEGGTAASFFRKRVLNMEKEKRKEFLEMAAKASEAAAGKKDGEEK